MNEQIFIGIDAGTSQIKCVAFSADGDELMAASCENQYQTFAHGRVEQNAHSTRKSILATLSSLVTKLGSNSERVVGMAITAMGDGMLLVDATGNPIHDGWLWLDTRAADIASEIEQYSTYNYLFQTTGTAINASQMRSQLLWMDKNEPSLLDQAHTVYHWKDYLYFCLTGVRATDPSEALFTFGSFASGGYDAQVIESLGLAHRSHLFPPIIDGMRQSHPLLLDVAESIGLSKSIPVSLGYVDVICSALGGGLYNNGATSAMTIMGTTGIHMRYVSSARELQLPDLHTGYTIAFPGGGFVQLQTNMAATMNIDWVLGLGVEAMTAHGHDASADSMLNTLDEFIDKATPGAALYHPYISSAGERGPFVNTNARASLEGLEQTSGFYDLVRSVVEGMCFAARDCYQSLGNIPVEVRLTGGASKSPAIQRILASVLNRSVRVASMQESGAAGAVMIATVQHGVYETLDDCTKVWLDKKLGDAVSPVPSLAKHYDALFNAYLSSRNNRLSNNLWEQLADIRKQHS